MYKLFLCLRYLRSRVIAYFAVISVALCVAMMLIAVSVMDGFLNKIELAAKGLFGDIIVESSSLSGLGRYDEFAQELQSVPEVEASSPFILTYGLIRVPNSDYRQTVQVAGIRLPQRAKVSDFAKGLFVQGGATDPTFDPPKQLVIDRVTQDEAQLERMAKADPSIAAQVAQGIDYHERSKLNFLLADQTDKAVADLEAEQDRLAANGGSDEAIKDVAAKLLEARRHQILPPESRIILGLGIPSLSSRTPSGQTIRYMVPGQQVSLTLLPLGRRTYAADILPSQKTFTVIDESRTDVSSIDSGMVYVPFETLQKLNDMGAETFVDGSTLPARCSAIHIKVRDGGLGNELRLQRIARQIGQMWDKFQEKHPDAASSRISVLTWRERQASIISSIASQRTLVVIMFGIISMTAVVLVFVLFYTIVVQKTRDIGVLKALGASSGGVAGIFLGYGAAVGLVGSIIGTIMGVWFVRDINPIHDWVGRTFGLVIWSKETFLFEKIPNEVQPVTTVVIALSAIAAGLIGALLPAVLAARMQPVEALRHE